MPAPCRTRLSLACFSPADIGSTSIKAYFGTQGQHHHVVKGSPDPVVHTIEGFRNERARAPRPFLCDVRMFKDETRICYCGDCGCSPERSEVADTDPLVEGTDEKA